MQTDFEREMEFVNNYDLFRKYRKVITNAMSQLNLEKHNSPVYRLPMELRLEYLLSIARFQFWFQENYPKDDYPFLTIL